VHALGDAASLFDKLLSEREVGPTFVEERFPADGGSTAPQAASRNPI
jgi:hypothetical protein